MQPEAASQLVQLSTTGQALAPASLVFAWESDVGAVYRGTLNQRESLLSTEDDDDSDPWDGWKPTPAKFAPLARDQGHEAEFQFSVRADAPNFGYVVIAIGNWLRRREYPLHPPEWALEECRALSEAAEISTRPVVGPASGPSPKTNIADGRLLEQMADLKIRPSLRSARGFVGQPSTRRLAIFVLGEGAVEKDSDRLQRLWRRDKSYRLKRAADRLLHELEALRAK